MAVVSFFSSSLINPKHKSSFSFFGYTCCAACHLFPFLLFCMMVLFLNYLNYLINYSCSWLLFFSPPLHVCVFVCKWYLPIASIYQYNAKDGKYAMGSILLVKF